MKKNPMHEDPLDAIYVEYMRPMQDEEPFMMGGSKYEFVRARYPDGRMDIGVYSQRGDVTYGYRHWRQMMNLDRTMQNPKGVYTTYSAWRAAAKKAGAVRFEGDKDIAQAFDGNGRGVAEWDGAEGYIYRKSEMQNPRGVYTTYSAWRAAAKKAGAVRFEGDKDIAQAFDANGRGVAEWDGAEGQIYRRSMINPRQRIAVSLSKSRQRNPVYDTGSDE